LTAVEEATKTDQERLADLVDDYNSQKAQIGRIALENCAFEQIAVSDCFKKGGWSAKTSLCRTENRSLNRCYEMQAKFLKALGYMNMNGRSVEDDERIQMHADRLYRRMIEQERLREEAKSEGRELPEFEPVMSKGNLARMLGTAAPTTMGAQQKQSVLDTISEERRAEFEKRTEGKSVETVELELRALEAEMAHNQVLSKDALSILEAEKRKRRERKEQGKMTFGDRIMYLWGKE